MAALESADGWGDGRWLEGEQRTEHHTKNQKGMRLVIGRGQTHDLPKRGCLQRQATLSSKNISLYISAELIYNRDWKRSVFLSGTPRGLALTHGQDKGNEIYDVL